MNNILKNWDAIRIVKLIAGVGFGIYAITSKEYLFLWLAGLFLLQSLFNISCCGKGGCSSSKTKQTKEVYKGIIKTYKPNQR